MTGFYLIIYNVLKSSGSQCYYKLISETTHPILLHARLFHKMLKDNAQHCIHVIRETRANIISTYLTKFHTFSTFLSTLMLSHVLLDILVADKAFDFRKFVI